MSVTTGWGARYRTPLAVLLALSLLVGGAAEGWRWYSDRAYVGSTKRITLDWTCMNGIFWTGSHGEKWWAGHNPVIHGPLETVPRAKDPRGSSLGELRASGQIHFDSYNRATFTSDRGGTFPLTRMHGRQFYTTDCYIPANPI